MELTMSNQDDSSPWEVPVKSPTGTSTTDTTILHGRGYFSELGVVRRKPCKPRHIALSSITLLLDIALIYNQLDLMHHQQCPNPAQISYLLSNAHLYCQLPLRFSFHPRVLISRVSPYRYRSIQI